MNNLVTSEKLDKYFSITKEALEKAVETKTDSEIISVRKSVNEIKTRLVKLARLEQQMAGF